MVLTRTHGIDKDSWFRQGLMVLTTPMILTYTHGIESILLSHTHERVDCYPYAGFFFEYVNVSYHGHGCQEAPGGAA